MLDQKSRHIASDGVDITIPRTVPYTGKAIISRFKGSYSDYSVQNRRLMNLLLDSNLTIGEMVNAGSDSYLSVVVKKEVIGGQDVSIIAHGMLCNTTLTVTRSTQNYDENGNPIDPTITTIISSVACRADQVTSRMRQEDPGLLPTTLLNVYATANSAVHLLDKATVAGTSYRVDDINTLEFSGCMVLQLSVWTG